MRLNLIIRRQKIVPMRAGIPPTWDRPDPPPNYHPPVNQKVNLHQNSLVWMTTIFHGRIHRIPRII